MAISTPDRFEVQYGRGDPIRVVSMEEGVGIPRDKRTSETFMGQEGALFRVIGPENVNVLFELPFRPRPQPHIAPMTFGN